MLKNSETQRDKTFWRELAWRFGAAREKFGDSLGARWIGPSAGIVDSEDAREWQLLGCDPPCATNQRGERWDFGVFDETGGIQNVAKMERSQTCWKEFVLLAKCGFARLRPAEGQQGFVGWLDQLRAHSPNFFENSSLAGYHDGQNLTTCSSGRIKRLFEASEEYCFTLATKEEEAIASTLDMSPQRFVQQGMLREKIRSYDGFAARIGIARDTLYCVTKEKRWISDVNYELIASTCGCRPEDLHPRGLPRPRSRRK